ncbi:MAG: NADH-quinone oxidoreductase subunit J [Chloroflexota bacterium]
MESVPRLIFIVLSLLTLVSGVYVVTSRNLFHAALFMMASFLGVAGLFVMLEAGFLAAAQLLVYIGAISILVIFAIMMTRRLMQTSETPYNKQFSQSFIVAGLVFVLLLFVIVQVWPVTEGGAPDVPAAVLQGSVIELGRSFVDPNQYVIPFEIVSVLLLAALIGAIVIAWPEKKQ